MPRPVSTPAAIARQRVQVFKPKLDNRYSEGDVVSHTQMRIPCELVERADEILPRLAEAKRHAVLIASDTALRPLLAAEVSPHLVVSLDPQPFNARHLTALPSVPDTWLVAEAILYEILDAKAARLKDKESGFELLQPGTGAP